MPDAGLKDLRKWSNVPVIVLSARVNEADKIDALDAGAGRERPLPAHLLRIYMGHLRHKLEDDPAQPRYLITETAVGSG